MAAAAVQQIRVDNLTFGVFPNANQTKTPLEHLASYTGSSLGAFRVLQGLDKTTRLFVQVLKEMGHTATERYSEVAGKLGCAWGALSIPRLFEVTDTALKTLRKWHVTFKGPVATEARDRVQKINNLFDFASCYLWSAFWFGGQTTVMRAAEVVNLGADVTDLNMAAEDWSLSKEYLGQLNSQPNPNEALSQRLADTTRYHLIKMAKATCSVFSGVVGLLVLTFGGPVLPALTLMTISLASTVFAASAHFFKETRQYELVDWHKWRGGLAGSAI